MFEGKESIADTNTKLPGLSDLENSYQLPVKEVLVIPPYTFSKCSHYSCFRGKLPIFRRTTQRY